MDVSTVIKLSAGNPGALTCLIGLKSLDKGELILDALEKLGIKGTDIYVLWSDICDKDYNLMGYLCNVVPSDQLKKAAGVQDRSGVAMLSSYLDGYHG